MKSFDDASSSAEELLLDDEEDEDEESDKTIISEELTRLFFFSLITFPFSVFASLFLFDRQCEIGWHRVRCFPSCNND